MLVIVDKFTKWIVARPIFVIKSKQVALFFLEIVHRFGVMKSIITDNNTQFTEKKFLRFYDAYHIRVDWSTMVHPFTNG